MNANARPAPDETDVSAAVSVRPAANSRPFHIEGENAGPRPRTEISLPSPLSRVIDTPGKRCKDSATFSSGNLLISSAEIASTIPSADLFISSALFKLARIPVTTTSSIIPSDCASAAPPVAASAAATHAAVAASSNLLVNVFSIAGILCCKLYLCPFTGCAPERPRRTKPPAGTSNAAGRHLL